MNVDTHGRCINWDNSVNSQEKEPGDLAFVGTFTNPNNSWNYQQNRWEPTSYLLPLTLSYLGIKRDKQLWSALVWQGACADWNVSMLFFFFSHFNLVTNHNFIIMLPDQMNFRRTLGYRNTWYKVCPSAERASAHACTGFLQPSMAKNSRVFKYFQGPESTFWRTPSNVLSGIIYNRTTFSAQCKSSLLHNT